ncbi:MAG: transporter [Dinoroseobacter sp.]|nr:transporter [Dinoroseobacter sp.]
MKTNIKTLAATAALCIAGIQPAMAIDTDPGDYTVLPSGTNALLGYFQHLESDTFSLDGTEVPSSELSGNIGILRYLRYSDIDGVPVGFQVIAPYGQFGDATVGGGDLEKADGLGDVTVGATVWALAAAPTDLTGTTLGFTLYGSFPTGDYEVGAANIGNGGFTLTPQIGLVQGLGGGRFLDATYDVAFTQDFDSNGFDVSTDPKHQAQIWLRQQFSEATYVAVGYSGIRGGDVSLNGTDTGAKIKSDQARLAIGHFINPTTQISGRIGYDFNADDGFKSEPAFQLRLMKLF